ncbi:NAD-dependent succinate-semialdehyde dehydrogenase [Pseudoalteromonas fenneropenaei]|uniref:NAD-dependent succinate-semialdehyde dehydrogenase n=1 Tax=Pseudoalteromonas fenneropenaei TaxID=1737459 RepID=A0ABV7CLH7_9GAMM
MDAINTRFGHLWHTPEQPATSRLTVYCKATGVALAALPVCNEQDVPEILARAQLGFDIQKALSAHQRSQQLQRWYELIIANSELLARLVTLECGKPLGEARAEVSYAAGFVSWFAEQAKRSYGQVIPSANVAQKLTTIEQPIGVVFAITPWNFPLAMITRKVAPAMAAGCSIVLKPSELTPLSAMALWQLAQEAGFAPEAWQVVHSLDAKGFAAAMCDSAVVRKVTFTGSTAVGRSLMAQSANTIKRLSLELGGNAPFIIFASSDLDAAIDALMVAKFRNAGQTCVAANRVLIESPCFDEFITKLTARVAKLKIGHGLEPDTDLGPLISPAAKATAERRIAEALSEGAVCHYRAEPLPSPFMAPVILTEVNQAMAIANLELFAPIITVQRFRSEADAIAIANAVPEGLASYFFSQDMAQVERVSSQLEYGMVGVNTGLISNPVAPFGGMKQSGLGREGAAQGLSEYLETKYLCQQF